ncbi:hypothetical protein QBC46DRAFT_449243 [Diplogelasinospora grovesii]|uniref:Protein kinase domain-containing protein n=1 Tax=Diplogelasinospora grovesii TaxID=303347 RepID=A0AAN6N7P4_9PEZI|nr:hypothetical protein QBC46DRAFT_449243 [Diplogelasinospora grovesii]
MPTLWSNPTSFVYPSVANLIAWVKHASSLGEADMQIFACEQLLAIPPDTRGKIRVPEVYRVIEHDDFVYIVMEYVHGQTLGALWRGSGKNMELREQLVAQVTNGISLFINNFHIPPKCEAWTT